MCSCPFLLGFSITFALDVNVTLVLDSASHFAWIKRLAPSESSATLYLDFNCTLGLHSTSPFIWLPMAHDAGLQRHTLFGLQQHTLSRFEFYSYFNATPRLGSPSFSICISMSHSVWLQCLFGLSIALYFAVNVTLGLASAGRFISISMSHTVSSQRRTRPIFGCPTMFGFNVARAFPSMSHAVGLQRRTPFSTSMSHSFWIQRHTLCRCRCYALFGFIVTRSLGFNATH